MSAIHETFCVQCPYVRARQYLHDTIADTSQGRAPELLELRATIPGSPIELSKGVRVQYTPGTDPMHFDEPCNIRWVPLAGGVYPSFEGSLTVRADERYETALLELTGTYAPPLGAAGRVFDAMLGRRVASITAQTLLSNIAADMVAKYEREESAKGLRS